MQEVTEEEWMDSDNHVRTRMSPRSIVLGAIEAATAAGGCEDMITGYWTHARLVARIAGELSAVTDVDPSQVAGAALAHDVGELLLLARHPEEYAAIRPPARAHHLQLELEQVRFGIDHALLGAEHLLDHRIPHPIADAVADHHEPFRDSELTTLVVAAADEIADDDQDRHAALDLLGISQEASEMFLLMAQRKRSPRHVGAARLRSISQ